ncbi:TonB-dependent receptor plug [Emticicia oligotrophica DSM 17448]|uniref:TonB-dependent receptor plug n=1 Tax=Emticicia oligotrophica (strain DSM 17448 / CIP 109782 / MTCC 6937 / GPTSA100-15) TaxID=929562 RepID=A0ABM5N4G6_EMTOG|nr:carboxypeptidase-like regulatory domain-containing protein [Emticicia oligotrophica]AFK04409.1 TonB-dependent receptor plug [Emticicia oligotrophica DSM 17448]
MKKIYIIFLILISWAASAQVNYRFSGYIRDTLDNKPLARASINIDFGKFGALTDDKGHFDIVLPSGEHAISVKFVGYRPFRETIYLRGDIVNKVYALKLIENELEEVIVSSKGAESNIQRPLLGVSQLSVKTLRKLPAAIGEVDILRGLQMLPGVTSVGEASNGVNIRGGTTDQNLLLVDDIPIFNPTHMFGLFTAFPSEAASSVEVYKGSTPARFGGRAASVMDVTLQQPSLDKFKMNGGISFVSNRLTLDMPVIKEKLGVMVSGRAAFNDFMLPVVSPKLKDIKANFADLVTKIFWRVNSRNTVTASGYYSKDFFQTKLLGGIGAINATSTQYDYRSKSFSARWFYAINNKYNLQTTVVSADYLPQTLLPELNSENKVAIQSGITYKQIKSNLNYSSDKHRVEVGVSTTRYDIDPGQLIPGTSKSVLSIVTPKEHSLESAIHAEDEISFSSKATLSVGLRYSNFLALGPGNVQIYEGGQPRDDFSARDMVSYAKNKVMKSYGGFEPRMGLKYSLNERTSLKMGYNLMRQYVQVATNTTTPLPTSRWKTSDLHIKPQVSTLLSGGLFHNLKGSIYELSLEAYYRLTNNIIDYKPGADFLLSSYPETQLLQGKNRSYGIEVMFSKKKGEATGWINYTYSRSQNKVNEGSGFGEQINFGNWYSANYDRPHSFNASVIINQGSHHDFSFNFSYSTGRPYTLPEGFLVYQGRSYPYYGVRNNARLPDYHRLDFAWNIYQPGMKNKRYKSHFTFTLFNVYGKKNAYSVFVRSTGTAISTYKLVVFGSPIPSLSYNFKF